MANRVLAGAFDGTYVLRVSRPGYNVLDPNLPASGVAFDSRWSTFAAIYATGTMYIPMDSNGEPTPVYSAYHGLGYVPFVLWFVTYNYQGTPYGNGNGNDGIEVRADANYLYFQDRGGFIAYGGTVRYFVTRTRV